ncbi:unnamed protein product [Rotaria sp. Silwood2]|nr:unnamed protein product [Rotaria sp. Silwood2]CAF2813309.1 unnamed protein product [Rotaria sp. Silwood2]CAF3065079.1 unnamed protein product [Rotaria sp. Silwood2]CAF3905858.1 unnamed protein product [Rotaria sp. Silwood2]CAF3998182.1 unnamed protein product [Rotaria sp. Silwood2]
MLLLLIIAGFQTSSAALSFFIYLIRKYPRVQKKTEIKLKNNENNQNLTMVRLYWLIYLDAIINEVLRFTSPSIGTNRKLMADYHLP